MKYGIVIPAGAVDEPVPELDGQTPLQAADIPTLDSLAAAGRIGTALTIPPGRPPSGEVSILSVLGYDPQKHGVARGSLEACGRGLEFGPHDQVFRCNLVTVTDDRMRDFTAGCIHSAQASRILADLNDALEDERVRFHAGRSYRNLFIWQDAGPLPKLHTTDPQEILDQPLSKHLPRGAGAESLGSLIRWSQRLLADHEINQVRRDLGENPANSVWVYGHGPLPGLPRFVGRFGVRGAMVAGVDLVRGLALRIGWKVPDVPGATGLPDTDYAAKGEAAVAALDGHDLVCVHVEAPDEAGHAGDARQKVAIIEAIDREIVAPLLERLTREPEYRILVMPSHATPVGRRMHTSDPTVFLMAGTGLASTRGGVFDELCAEAGEVHVDRASELMEYFLRR